VRIAVENPSTDRRSLPACRDERVAGMRTAAQRTTSPRNSRVVPSVLFLSARVVVALSTPTVDAA
jgi:hypothetical protein